MLYKNGITVLSNFTLAEADVRVSKGRIMEIVPRGAICDPEGEIDISGNILAPGFIDMHIHGCNGADFSSDGDTAECLSKMSEFLKSHGIIAFAPAAMTMPYNELCALMTRYQKATVNPCSGAIPVGIYLEGPFLSTEKCGAQPTEYIQSPNIDKLIELNNLSGENIRVVCVAPEVKGAMEFIPQATQICRVSAAHTASNYETMRNAIEFGITNATHLYNAMNSISHREPNGITALIESDAFCELICDGIHVHPAIIRMTHKLIGRNRLCIVSDATSATGLGDGKFKLGEDEIQVHGNKARLADGTIAGSVTTIRDGFHNAIAFGIPPLDALRAVTLNPARALGIDNRLGSIEVGKMARLILLDENFNFIKNV